MKYKMNVYEEREAKEEEDERRRNRSVHEWMVGLFHAPVTIFNPNPPSLTPPTLTPGPPSESCVLLRPDGSGAE